MKYRTVKLKEIANIVMGQSPKSDFYNTDGVGTPFLQGVRTFGDNYPIIDTYTTSFNREASAGQILFSVRAPVGRVNWATQNIAIGRGLAAIKVKSGYSKDYLYYLFKKIGSRLDSLSTGTVFTSINKKELEELSLKIPIELTNQERIANYLKKLDLKIDLNNQINDNLLELITLIWSRYSQNISNKVPLKKIAKDIVTGKTPSTKIKANYGSDIPFVKIPDMHNKVFIDETLQSLSLLGADSQKNKYLPANSIMVSCIGTPGLVSLTGSIAQTNQQINSLVLDEKFIYWVFLELRSLSNKIGNLGSGGTTIKNLNKSDFSKLEVVVPDNDILLDKFNSIAKPIFESIHTNSFETNKLNQLKKRLLHKFF